MDFIQIAKDAKDASLKIADISTELKNKACSKLQMKSNYIKMKSSPRIKKICKMPRVLLTPEKLQNPHLTV